MRGLLPAAAVILAAGVFVWASFSWFEAEREVRILCSGFRVGDGPDDVVGTLRTGRYLTFTAAADGAGLEVWSPYTMGRSRCAVTAEAGVVTGSARRDPVPLDRVAAWLAASAFTALACFQLLLAGGAPLGRGAWGGAVSAFHRRSAPLCMIVGWSG